MHIGMHIMLNSHIPSYTMADYCAASIVISYTHSICPEAVRLLVGNKYDIGSCTVGSDKIKVRI